MALSRINYLISQSRVVLGGEMGYVGLDAQLVDGLKLKAIRDESRLLEVFKRVCKAKKVNLEHWEIVPELEANSFRLRRK